MPIPIKNASLVVAAPIMFWDLQTLTFIRAEELSAHAKVNWHTHRVLAWTAC